MIVIAFRQSSGALSAHIKCVFRLLTGEEHPGDYQQDTWAVIPFVQK
jgi:hypothetical protein